MKFHRTFDVKAFNQALRDYHPLFEQPYLFDEIQGMLRGFVDLVFRHQGKYYVLDYKTNHLGEQTENYQQNALVNTMKQQHYDLQSLFYTLALHHYGCTFNSSVGGIVPCLIFYGNYVSKM